MNTLRITLFSVLIALTQSCATPQSEVTTDYRN